MESIIVEYFFTFVLSTVLMIFLTPFVIYTWCLLILCKNIYGTSKNKDKITTFLYILVIYVLPCYLLYYLFRISPFNLFIIYIAFIALTLYICALCYICKKINKTSVNIVVILLNIIISYGLASLLLDVISHSS